MNRVIFRFLILFSSLFLVDAVFNCRFWLYPLFLRASVYGGICYLLCSKKCYGVNQGTTIPVLPTDPPRCERRIVLRRWTRHPHKMPKQVEAVKTKMGKIFKYHNLHITIQANKKVMDFLDPILDLRTGIHS